MGVLEHFHVPLNGSVMAEAALPVALGLGQPLGVTTEVYQCRLLMVPLGGTHDSELVLHYAGVIARATGASVLLRSVIPTLGTASGDLVVSATFSPTATSAVLDLAQADELRQLGVEVRTEVAAFARDVRADLLLLSTHGRAGLDGTLSGSIAPQVLGERRIPTMLVRVAKVS